MGARRNPFSRPSEGSVPPPQPDDWSQAQGFPSPPQGRSADGSQVNEVQWRTSASSGPAAERRLWQKKRLWVPVAMLSGFVLGGGGGQSTQPLAGMPASTVTQTATRSAVTSTVTTTATATVRSTAPAVTVTATPDRVTAPAATVTRTVTKTATAKATSRVGLANTSGTGSTDPRFGTCKEALANGYGNYRQGVDEEYSWYRDADNDGVVCE